MNAVIIIIFYFKFVKCLFFCRYYGLMMWFPEMFNRFDEYSRSGGGETVESICQVNGSILTIL